MGPRSNPQSKTARGKTSASSFGRWRWLVVLFLLLAAGFLLQPAIGQGMLRLADNRLEMGDVSSARRWLERSETWAGNGVEQLLMWAAISRTQGDLPGAAEFIDQAEQRGAATPGIQRERKLLQLSTGREGDLQEIESVLGQVDVSLTEAYDAILMGVLANDERLELAEQLIRQWQDQSETDPNAFYWSAHLAEMRGQQQTARRMLETALRLSPFHQRARLALAHLDEREDRLHSAYELFRQLRTRDLVVEAQISMARVLRRMGRYQDASLCLADLNSVEARTERAMLAFEQGDYEEAIEQFRSVPDDENDEILAIALHMDGQHEAAAQLLEQIATRSQAKHRTEELRTRPDIDSIQF